MADSITQSSVFLIFKLNIVDRPAHYQNQKALTQVKALHILQDALLKQLEVLVQENWK